MFRFVVCPISECDQRCLAKELALHQATCRHRFILPLQIVGLSWSAHGVQETVRICNIADFAGVACQRVRDLVDQSRGPLGKHLWHEYDVLSITLCNAPLRCSSFVARAYDLQARLSRNSALFNLLPWQGDDALACTWREMIVNQFDSYPRFELGNLDRVRVAIGFHATGSMDVAHSILAGNFAKVCSLDAGFFGQGIF